MELKRVVKTLPHCILPFPEALGTLEVSNCHRVGGAHIQRLKTEDALSTGPLSFHESLYFGEQLVLSFDELEHAPPLKVSVPEKVKEDLLPSALLDEQFAELYAFLRLSLEQLSLDGELLDEELENLVEEEDGLEGVGTEGEGELGLDQLRHELVTHVFEEGLRDPELDLQEAARPEAL